MQELSAHWGGLIWIRSERNRNSVGNQDVIISAGTGNAPWRTAATFSLSEPAVTSSPYLLLLIITKKKTTGITLSPRKQQKTKTLLSQVKILISKTRKKSTWHFLPEYVFPLVFNFSFNLTDLVCVIRQENLAKQLYQQQCRTMQRCHVAVFISVRLIY